MGAYNHHSEITKEVLDGVKAGNLVKINDWKMPLKVMGVSENYFVMARNIFGNFLYSVCEKKPWDGIMHNSMRGGKFHCGTDNMLFGYFGFNYKFDDAEQINDYLQAFETGEIELSHRSAVPIYDFYVK